jgi:hypothetical protein
LLNQFVDIVVSERIALAFRPTPDVDVAKLTVMHESEKLLDGNSEPLGGHGRRVEECFDVGLRVAHLPAPCKLGIVIEPAPMASLRSQVLPLHCFVG